MNNMTSEAAHGEFDAQIRPLRQDELETVSGGGLFVLGFIAGVIACNVKNDRPWYEF